MGIRHQSLVIALFMSLAACGAKLETPERPEINPKDFALVPCGPGLAERPCALAVAGGKRVLFGAPAGVAATLSRQDLKQLDAIILFSLRAADIEGLDEVRNESWWAGRDEPLLVVGPEGTTAVVDALNIAFEQADALRVVEQGIPRGGYDAAVLEARESVEGIPDFDTGDVQVTRRGSVLQVRYGREAILTISVCAPTQSPPAVVFIVDVPLTSLNCNDAADLQWPLTETVFIVKN